MKVFNDDRTANAYCDHWIKVNFLLYTRNRPKILTATRTIQAIEYVWNDESFWLPLLKMGIEWQSPEEMGEVMPNQYTRMMARFTSGLVDACERLAQTPDDTTWAGMMEVIP